MLYYFFGIYWKSIRLKIEKNTHIGEYSRDISKVNRNYKETNLLTIFGINYHYAGVEIYCFSLLNLFCFLIMVHKPEKQSIY